MLRLKKNYKPVNFHDFVAEHANVVEARKLPLELVALHFRDVRLQEGLHDHVRWKVVRQLQWPQLVLYFRFSVYAVQREFRRSALSHYTI